MFVTASISLVHLILRCTQLAIQLYECNSDTFLHVHKISGQHAYVYLRKKYLLHH